VSIFQNKLFSVRGVVERAKNVGATYKAIFTPNQRVVANIQQPTVKRVVEAAANRPFTTAAIATGGVMAAKALTGGGVATAASVGGRSAYAAGAMPTTPILKAGLYGAGAGLLGGMLLTRSGSSPGGAATGTIQQQPRQDTPIDQSQNWHTYTQTHQDTYQSLIDSPGAYVGASQRGPDLYQPGAQSATPQQVLSAPQEITGGQGGAQGISPLILLGGAALMLYLLGRKN